ncbi:helix-turn-helix domain-containing protein [Rhizorhapis sp. SPR117]|uniref:helix-turn-helix domain-containing protein n=1 Tax=Rhizorhapis sp. SPR117 TaxID=2912611 RepID=UPI001F25A10B|nr:short-chain fatty acyl-CoA regulator family protein [Rhizorhapis sp. SPR117]
MGKQRLYAGERLRSLRLRLGLSQSVMAARMGISNSYLSQLEHDDRPMTSAIRQTIGRTFPMNGADFEVDDEQRRTSGVRDALTDPLFRGMEISDGAVDRLVELQPAIADRLTALHQAYRGALNRLQFVDDVISSDMGLDGRLPWEEVRDWFHLAGNYVDSIDREAERMARDLWGRDQIDDDALLGRLKNRHQVVVDLTSREDSARLLRRYDRRTKTLTLSSSMPPDSRRFALAHQLAALELADVIAGVRDEAELRSDEARQLLSIGLANYAAGALLMPYDHFRRTARSLRHDIDRLCQYYSVSFEQACHRLSTLQRPGECGTPFFFCRVDMAGNITKRHSATRLEFARFGGACPLWVVHEAVAIPDRIVVQLAQTPDGARYVCMAKGLVKPSGSYARAPRRYAVALGCEIEHARSFVYADQLDITNEQAPTLIGISCRICPRTNCDQRAFPPVDRSLSVDPDVREIVPYKIK